MLALESQRSPELGEVSDVKGLSLIAEEMEQGVIPLRAKQVGR